MIPAPALDFTVLTGFLGSGKTTLIRDFLERGGAADTAVIVNEIGEIGLDGVILREEGGGTPTAMLSNGCVCCQAGNDLMFTVADLLGMERPADAVPLRRIVLETSGVAKPGPVLRQLVGIGERLGRISVVATYDPLNAPVAGQFEEAAAQWAAANRIVVTKADRLCGSALARARSEAAGVAPLAEVVATADRDDCVASLMAPARPVTAMPGPALASTRGKTWPRMAVTLARPAGVLRYADLAAWLDNLTGALGERLLRVKGVLRVEDCADPLLIQSVGTLFSSPVPIRPRAGDDTRFLVIVARDLEAGEIAGVEPLRLFETPSPEHHVHAIA